MGSLLLALENYKETTEIMIMKYLPLIFLFQIRKMFDKADKDGDGKLTKEEWYNVLNTSGCDTSM